MTTEVSGQAASGGAQENPNNKEDACCWDFLLHLFGLQISFIGASGCAALRTEQRNSYC